MDESLSHTKWDCKYHVVFIPKCRRKTLYGQLRQHLGEVFKRLTAQKESRIEEGHLMVDHVHMMIAIPPKYAVSQVVGSIKGKSAIHLAVITQPPAMRTGVTVRGALSGQGAEDDVEGVGAVESCGVDCRSHVRFGLGRPHGAITVGHFSLDHAGAELAFRTVVGCALPRCAILPGGNPGRRTLAPAGSTRGGSGGDE